MRITFIRPHITDVRSSAVMEPLVFAILAGLTPPDVELDFFDERLEPIPSDHQTDMVGLTVDTYTARRAYQIASNFRRRGVPVVMGGYHPSFLPEEALVYADAVVIGDAEGVWEQLVADAQQGKLHPVYQDSRQPPLEGLKFDRSIFAGKGYRLVAPVQFGRGCQYACDFCSIHAFYGSQTRQRPVNEVVAEIEALDRRFIVFVDDNLFVDLAKAEELFRALIPLNILWACQISVDIAQHDHLMDLMARSGCFCAMVGIESLRKDNLQQMRKAWNLRHSDYESAIREFRDRGIMVYASLVFGYDYDRVDTFDSTAQFAIRTKCAMANVNTLAPMPGSRLYNRMANENRLLFDRWWLHPDYRYGQAAFRPLRMTADQLAEGCLRVRRVFHGYGSILKRALDPLANSRNLYHLGLFLAMNLLARRELAYKLGHRLGADIPLEPPLEDVPLTLGSSADPRLSIATGK